MQIRRGSAADGDSVLALLDEAIDWLVSQGRTGQWGTEHWSADETRRNRVHSLVAEGELWIAELDGQPVGAMILNETPMPYVAPVDEPELYVRLLVASRARRGLGIGQTLVEFAREEARSRAIGLLRVDCYAGDDQQLVNFYERAGFQRSFDLKVGDWPGMVLEQRV